MGLKFSPTLMKTPSMPIWLMSTMWLMLSVCSMCTMCPVCTVPCLMSMTTRTSLRSKAFLDLLLLNPFISLGEIVHLSFFRKKACKKSFLKAPIHRIHLNKIIQLGISLHQINESIHWYIEIEDESRKCCHNLNLS